MTTVKDMFNRFKSFDPTEAAGECMTENKEKVTELIRQQLLEGKDSKGDYLKPTYSTDPYFKKPGAGERYAEWKAKLFPSANRPKDVPNLIITGEFHRSIDFSVNGELINYTSNVYFGAGVMNKFGDKILGLTPDSKKTAWVEFVRAPFVGRLKEVTGTA